MAAALGQLAPCMPALGESGRGMRALPLLQTNIHHIWTIVETSLTTQRWSGCLLVRFCLVRHSLPWSYLACLAVRNSQTVLQWQWWRNTSEISEVSL